MHQFHPPSLTNIPLGLKLLFVPLFKKSGHHLLGAVALVERPQVFGLQGHFVAFNGHAERKRESLIQPGTLSISSLTGTITVTNTPASQQKGAGFDSCMLPPCVRQA